jgi:hypothetical protein
VGTRAVTWVLTLPLVGAGVLVGHDLAYRLAGASDPAVHDYLAHLPQLVAILATVGLLGLAVDQRAIQLGSGRFGFLGAAVYALQEHVERLVHTGSVPLILGDRTFILGVALQIPIGLACLAIARVLARELHAPMPARVRVVGSFALGRIREGHTPIRSTVRVALRGRSPPRVIGSTG